MSHRTDSDTIDNASLDSEKPRDYAEAFQPQQGNENQNFKACFSFRFT